MSVVRNLKIVFTQPKRALRKIVFKLSPYIKNDKLYISMLHCLTHGTKMHWDNPQTYNEKIHWLKLWSKDKGFGKYVDKYEVREHIKNTIGEQYLIPLLGVWDRFEDIDFSTLPDEFVLKAAHGHGALIVKDKNNIPEDKIRQLKREYNSDLFLYGREYPYKGLKKRIIAEKLMTDDTVGELRDYKFYCFNGEPKFFLICSDRFKGEVQEPLYDYYDMELNHLPMTSGGGRRKFDDAPPRIVNYDDMVRISKELSKGFPFIRVDLYNINGKIYFGEMTFFDGTGLDIFEPKEWELKLGSYISLPNND